ncbi:hypothetical protein K437DRAFT_254095 [Tilletiaria anomala UBC 951]|uniref:Uncharacterized protein n=1 Tax=Tilletiaria anomala (strain ATCC 24038 / CBS 436.72 / UBC 951) TaxID=1037660 RepID=A0A066WFF3_TILAU|nr:uncharacterized protein K437DRAFT_254095 [Tilletiaria anomala UBC 951]KDN52511.1 hypothetical protein K437DRAFT_254095 [Tilletiaria anomala UBC 951]
MSHDNETAGESGSGQVKESLPEEIQLTAVQMGKQLGQPSSPKHSIAQGNDISLNINVGPSASLPTHHYAHIIAKHMETGGNHVDLQRMGSVGTSAGLGPVTPSHEETDPLLLRSRVVNEQEIRMRVSGKGRKLEKAVSRFYETQNSHINNLLKSMAQHASDGADERNRNALKVRIAVYTSIAANFVLAGLQLYAAISSLSLSLFATAADSVFDPFANLVLNWLHRKASNVDERKWPIGGSRFESIGNIVYAFLMGSVSLILIVESLRDIATHKSGGLNDFFLPSLIAVGVAFCVKLSLAIYCFGLRKFSSQVQVLYEDHRNDLFINGFGIFTSAAGAKIAWWLDPMGAVIISFAIIFSWSRTAYLQFRELAGQAAPTEFMQLVTYNAMLHHANIEKIDSCKAYHSGPKYIVEVDIVMKPETPLWLSHDVSQDLQDRLEMLPMVERAFIHVDHESDHKPEHSRKDR